MPVLRSLTAANAALTEATVYGPVTVSSALVAISPIVKPIWLNEPTPPETFEPYLARIALNSTAVGLVFPSSGVSSAFTKSLPSHFEPREVARKSVLHGVEQAQDLTRFSRLSVC